MDKIGSYKWGRYRLDWVDAVHFNNKGKKLCHIASTDPHHTTIKENVTCRYCKSKLDKMEKQK